MRAILFIVVWLGGCSFLLVGPGVPPTGSGSQGEAVRPEPAQPDAGFAYWWHVTGKERARVSAAGLAVRADVAVLYQQGAGMYPRFFEGRELNGGVPQRTDMSAHLRELRNDINREIPDAGFTGWAVLDYEAWEPIWELTPSEYRDASREIVRRANPLRQAADIDRLAQVAYESAARRFLTESLREAKRQRPRAKWGVYALPWPTYAPYKARIAWLWDLCDAVYPCIYTPMKTDEGSQIEGFWGPGKYRDEIVSRIALARAAAGKKPVVPFVWVLYDGNKRFARQFLNDADLQTALTAPREAGAQGVILWNEAPNPAAATDLQQYVQRKLAPALRVAR